MGKTATRLTTFLVAVVVSLGAGGSLASAYPPEDGVQVLVSSTVVAPGQPFEATLTGCSVGEVVDFTLASSTVTSTATAVCTNPHATATLTAPTAEGTYILTARGRVSGVSATVEITIEASTTPPPSQLPDTGSGGAATLTQVGAGLLISGLGLVAVVGFRRRRLAVTG